MKIIYQIIFILINLLILENASYSQTSTEHLNEVKNANLIHLLNDFEVLADYHEKDSPYSVRIIRLREHGECDGPANCPNEVLYIAVSSFDEAPDQKLFILPKAFNWKFVRWINVKIEEGTDKFLTFEIQRAFPPTLPPSAKAKDQEYEVGVNPYSGGYIKFK